MWFHLFKCVTALDCIFMQWKLNFHEKLFGSSSVFFFNWKTTNLPFVRLAVLLWIENSPHNFAGIISPLKIWSSSTMIGLLIIILFLIHMLIPLLFAPLLRHYFTVMTLCFVQLANSGAAHLQSNWGPSPLASNLLSEPWRTNEKSLKLAILMQTGRRKTLNSPNPTVSTD